MCVSVCVCVCVCVCVHVHGMRASSHIQEQLVVTVLVVL